MEESNVRHDIYKMLQAYGIWPIHARDAIICPNCHKPVVAFEQGRPDLINLNPEKAGTVVECKAVDATGSAEGKTISFAFAEIREEQRRWLNGWAEKWGKGYLGLGTVNEKPRRIWLIDWQVWLNLEGAASLAGRKSVRLQRLEEDYSKYKLIRITGGWLLPPEHTIRETINMDPEAQEE